MGIGGSIVIEKRLQTIPAVAERVHTLPVHSLQRLIAEIRRTFYSQHEEPTARVDTGDMDAAEVRSLLIKWGCQGTQRCYLIWLADNEGVESDTASFVQYYDELWLPGSDDVWVAETNLNWLIFMDHEEVFEYRKRMNGPPPRP